MKEIDLVYRTMFAELGQRSLDAAFETDFPLGGRFVNVPVKGRSYWYFDLRSDGMTLAPAESLYPPSRARLACRCRNV